MYLEQNPDTGFYTNTNKPWARLRRVHDESLCADRGCAIHNHPSDHPLKDAPMYWRTDRGILERICEHGIGHPDHDSALYLESIGQSVENIHGCDSCCGLAYEPSRLNDVLPRL